MNSRKIWSGISVLPSLGSCLSTILPPKVPVSISSVGPLLKEGIDDIAKKKEGYFEVYPIDCNTDDATVLKDFPYCTD